MIFPYLQLSVSETLSRVQGVTRITPHRRSAVLVMPSGLFRGSNVTNVTFKDDQHAFETRWAPRLVDFSWSRQRQHHNDFRCIPCCWSRHQHHSTPRFPPFRRTLPVSDFPRWCHFEPCHHSSSTIRKESVAQSSTWPKGTSDSRKRSTTQGQKLDV